MSKMVNVSDSSLGENFSRALYDQDGYDVAAAHVDKLLDVFFTGISEYLHGAKTKEYPVAYCIEAKNGEFVVAAIVQYVEGTDGQPGHWNYVWTPYKEDVPNNAKIEKNSNPLTWVYFRGVSNSKYSFGFEPNSEGIICARTFMSISQWLEDNADENEEVGIKQDGVFQARVAVENGEKVKAIEVIGETKALIKDDAASEV